MSLGPDPNSTAVKFPESQEEILASLFFSIHGMTHQFVDEITLKSAEEKYEVAYANWIWLAKDIYPFIRKRMGRVA
jgi:hypothetical protein